MIVFHFNYFQFNEFNISLFMPFWPGAGPPRPGPGDPAGDAAGAGSGAGDIAQTST